MVALVNHPEAWQFNEPVKEEFATYYYKLTKNPRDFNQVIIMAMSDNVRIS